MSIDKSSYMNQFFQRFNLDRSGNANVNQTQNQEAAQNNNQVAAGQGNSTQRSGQVINQNQTQVVGAINTSAPPTDVFIISPPPPAPAPVPTPEPTPAPPPVVVEPPPAPPPPSYSPDSFPCVITDKNGNTVYPAAYLMEDVRILTFSDSTGENNLYFSADEYFNSETYANYFYGEGEGLTLEQQYNAGLIQPLPTDDTGAPILAGTPEPAQEGVHYTLVEE